MGGFSPHFLRLFRWLVVSPKRRPGQLQATPESENLLARLLQSSFTQREQQERRRIDPTLAPLDFLYSGFLASPLPSPVPFSPFPQTALTRQTPTCKAKFPPANVAPSTARRTARRRRRRRFRVYFSTRVDGGVHGGEKKNVNAGGHWDD